MDGRSGLVAAPGKPNSSLNWPIRSVRLSLLPNNHLALPNGTALSTVSFPKSPRTGPANHAAALYAANFITGKLVAITDGDAIR